MPANTGKIAALLIALRRLPFFALLSIVAVTIWLGYQAITAIVNVGAAKAVINGFADQSQIDSIKSDVGKIEKSIERMQQDTRDALRALRDEVGAMRRESHSIAEHVAVVQARFDDHINFTLGTGAATERTGPRPVKKRNPNDSGWRAETVQSSTASPFHR